MSATARLQIHRIGPQRRGDIDGLQQLPGRLATVIVKIGIDGELMIHRFDVRRTGGQCVQSLVYRACPQQQRGHKSRVLHVNPAAVIEEGRGALVEERNLVQADAWMHG
jgi:hypothetical protein